MRKRAVWIEPRFADLKLWHHGSRFRLRGLLKVNIEALLKATGQNIHQLLKTKTPGKLVNPAQAMAFIPYPYLIFSNSLILRSTFNATFSTLWTIKGFLVTILPGRSHIADRNLDSLLSEIVSAAIRHKLVALVGMKNRRFDSSRQGLLDRRGVRNRLS